MSNVRKITILGDDLLEKSVEITPSYHEKINTCLSKIDSKGASITDYGVVGQNKLNSFSEVVLKQMRSSNTNGIDLTLNTLTAELKAFDKAINGWSFKRLFETTKKRIIRINSEYERIENTVKGIELILEKQYRTLSVDLKLLDKLFEQNKLTYEELSVYIYAGELKVKEFNEKILPEIKKESVINSPDNRSSVFTEELLTRLERRLHNLRLSKVVCLQQASQIKLIESNNTALADKLYSCMVNTIPLWRNQMILALSVGNSQRANETQNAISKFINKFLKKNNRTLMRSNRQLAEESERDILNLSTLHKINADLLTTVNNVIITQQEARRLRKSAENSLLSAERELNELSRNIGS